jgi:N6-adenosine-specific RNA methylase IME4
MIDFNKFFVLGGFAFGTQQVQIESIRVGRRYRPVRNLQPLISSIVEVGLLHPVVIHPSGMLIAGARRVAACQALGWDEIPVRVVDLHRVLKAEHDENVVREPFTLSEMVAIKRDLEPALRAEARERMTLGKISPGSDTGRTRDRVAAGLGVSGRTLEKAEAIVKAAEAEPEKYSKLVEEMDRTGHAEHIARRLKIAKQAEAIRAEPPPLPQRGPYRCIIADPPWQYDVRETDPFNQKIFQYPMMSTAEICAMAPHIASIAHRDCVLWLWTTNAHMFQAKEVLDAWGFEPKTILTWIKDRMGLGHWLRGQTEHCIMAVRGKPTIVLTNQTTALHGPVREHSQKPNSFYELVESLCPGSGYAYLFARGFERPRWDCHGDEIARVAA